MHVESEGRIQRMPGRDPARPSLLCFAGLISFSHTPEDGFVCLAGRSLSVRRVFRTSRPGLSLNVGFGLKRWSSSAFGELIVYWGRGLVISSYRYILPAARIDTFTR